MIQIDTVILSFLKRERNFAIVLDRCIMYSMNVPGRPKFLAIHRS
jgi:hypothetical protein